MKQHALTEVVRVSGKIVEIFERDGLSLAKVSLNACCIEVIADPATDIHLGDTVTVDTLIRTSVARPASTLAE